MIQKSSLGGTLLTLLVIGSAGYYYRANLSTNIDTIKEMIHPTAPCSSPIVYSLGTLDTQFGVTRAQFLKDIAAATHIWEDPYGKNFFEYADDVSTSTGTTYGATAKNILTINFLYDYRQKATDTMSTIGTTITANKATYDALKQKYADLTATYNAQKAQIDSQLTSYNSQKSAYDQKVQYWNTHGGAPRAEYAALEQERQALDAQANAINSGEAALNTLGESINSTVSIINRIASELNLNVDKYNTVGATTGEQFDEGEYIRDDKGQRINIYQFNDREKLIRVLAHELGHSLGLDHVLDPEAIMYAQNEGAGGALTADDRAELAKVCQIKQ